MQERSFGCVENMAFLNYAQRRAIRSDVLGFQWMHFNAIH